jgi:hypothetical protein
MYYIFMGFGYQISIPDIVFSNFHHLFNTSQKMHVGFSQNRAESWGLMNRSDGSYDLCAHMFFGGVSAIIVTNHWQY